MTEDVGECVRLTAALCCRYEQEIIQQYSLFLSVFVSELRKSNQGFILQYPEVSGVSFFLLLLS